MNLEPELKAVWPTFQTMLAQILSAYYAQRSQSQKRPTGTVLTRRTMSRMPIPASLVHQPTRAWNFRINERIHGGCKPWPFSRRAWHAFNYWASKVRIPIQDIDQAPPTLLEAYLSYLAVHRGYRFQSGVDPKEHGDWIMIQLDRFKCAWHCFQKLTGAELLLGPRPMRLPLGGWHLDYGLPRLELLNRYVKLPLRNQMHAYLSQIPRNSRQLERPSEHAQMWRRWAPGGFL